MPNKTASSERRKADYKMRKDGSVSKKNAAKRLAKHLKKHPTDVQSKEQRIPNWPEGRKR